MIPRDFFFSYFYLFWHLFWLIPLLGVLLYAQNQRKKGAALLIQKNLQPSVLIPRDFYWNTLSLICFSLGWVFAVIAMMGPMGNEYYRDERANITGEHASLELFLVIDVSQSMAVKDGRNKQMRLDNATEIADKLVAKVKNDPVALFAFTSDLVPFVPLTFDRIFVRLMLKELNLNEGDSYGTNFQILFEQLKKQVEVFPKSPKAIVLFSDGGDAIIEASSKDDRETAIASLIKTIKSLNVPVFTVGIGSSVGGEVPDVGSKVISRLDEALMKEISEQTGGRYFSGNNQPAEEIALRINQSLERPRTNEGVTSASKGLFRYYFQIPLTLAICLFGLSFLMPTTKRSFFIFLVMIPLQTYSADPGETFYEAGQYKEASEWFSGELKHLPPEWLRNKLLYNLGTSLMAENKWQEAERAFFAISKEAYDYPLFRLRLLYNQIVALYHQNEDVLPIIKLADLKELNELNEKIKNTPQKSDPLDQAIYLFRLASVLDKPTSPLLAEALSKVALSKEMQEKNVDEITFMLIQLKLKQASTPKEFLEWSLDALAVASGITNGQKKVEENAGHFYPLVLEWQKKKFLEGICQCQPWDEVLPRFTEGLRMLQIEPFEKQIFYSYDKWLEALQMLQQETSPSKEEKPEDSAIRELREMQSLDKTPSKPKMKPVGGMPW